MSYLALNALRTMRAHQEVDAVTAEKFLHVIWANHAKWGASLLPEAMALRLQELRDRRHARQQVEAYAEGGRLYLLVTQRDCDMAEWSYRWELPGTFEALDSWLEKIHADAEGPVWWNMVSKAEWDAWQQPRSRDLALEAFEDGHPHVVYA